MFLVPPLVVTVNPNNVTAKVYGSVTFFCYSNGYGDLSFVWEYGDSVISASNSTLQQNSLTIESVLPQHQGQYKCTVTSPYSTSSSYALATLNLNGNAIYSMHSCSLSMNFLFLAPSFDSQTVLQQVSSNASANTITVFMPQIDNSDGPIRYTYST